MLAYKAWRESRTRFLVSAVALAWGCYVVLLIQRGVRAQVHPPMPYARYLWSAVYKGNGVRDLYIVLVLTLGLGGLLQERARGTAGFTLGLPVSRSRVVWTRAVVGLVELALLACIPAVLLPIGSSLVGQEYPADQAWRFTVLWTVCGSALFSIAFAWSTLVSSDYAAWVASFITIVVYAALMHFVPALMAHPALDLFNLMSGSVTPYVRDADAVGCGPLPWGPLTILAGLTVVAIATAVCVTARQEFP
jgi:hypothetical protein